MTQISHGELQLDRSRYPLRTGVYKQVILKSRIRQVQVSTQSRERSGRWIITINSVRSIKQFRFILKTGSGSLTGSEPERVPQINRSNIQNSKIQMTEPGQNDNQGNY